MGIVMPIIIDYPANNKNNHIVGYFQLDILTINYINI